MAGAAMKIADITIGERFRHDLGDLRPLAASIAQIGLLHPVVVTPDGTLIAGQRRIEACKLLGWTDVPATVVDLAAIMRGEHDENTVRKDFTPREAVAITYALEPVEKAAAARRELAGVEPTDKLSQGRALDHVAAAVGMSRPTLVKARRVFEAAEAEPEKFGALADKVDAGSLSIDRAFREIGREQMRASNRDLVAAARPVPVAGDARYRTIVIDPPWDWGDEGDADQFGRARPTYGTMTIEEISALPVGDMAEDSAHIYLWITNRSLPKGFDLLDSWGFRYVTCLTWCKPSIGMGNYYRGSTEQVLFGVRGSLPLLQSNVGTWFAAPRNGRHSGKPDEFYTMVETCSPGPWLEMFAREQRAGWASWGAEVE